MAGTSWGAASRLLAKDVGDEQKELEEAAKKKGLWGTIGSTLGGLGGLALINAWNPVGWLAAGVAGASSLAGGALGGSLVDKDTKRVLKGEGTKFLGDERKELTNTLQSELLKGAVTSAMTAGVGQYGAAAAGKKAASTALTEAGKEVTKETIAQEMAKQGTKQFGLKDIFKGKKDVAASGLGVSSPSQLLSEDPAGARLTPSQNTQLGGGGAGLSGRDISVPDTHATTQNLGVESAMRAGESARITAPGASGPSFSAANQLQPIGHFSRALQALREEDTQDEYLSN